MNPDELDIVDQAIRWHLRQPAMTAEDWRAFTLWLEADPAHAAAFDAVEMDDALIDLGADQPVAANDRAPRAWYARAWPRIALGAAAAAACAMYLVPSALPRGSDPYVVATAVGQRQELALSDGTRITLSGGTTIALDRANPRVAELREGEAVFRVRHDAADPFTLRSGGLVVQDLGTVFDVARAGKRLDVQVAEGSVLFQPDREAVTLKAGAALTTMEGSDRVELSRVEAGDVGGWREGRLTFAGASLRDVADAVRRQSGIPVSAASTLAHEPFTGVVRLTGSAERDVLHVAALVGARARRTGGGWVLEPVENAAP